jgi:hypothetical protein
MTSIAFRAAAASGRPWQAIELRVRVETEFNSKGGNGQRDCGAPQGSEAPTQPMPDPAVSGF